MSKRVYLRALALLFAVFIGALSTSCGRNTDGTAGGGGLVDPDKEAYKAVCKDINFIPPEAKKEWIEPLTRLLTNVKRLWEIDPNEEDGGEEYVVYGYYVGLLDIDMNGTPELLVDVGGGSSGNAYYYVYDILTGEHIGSLHGAANDNSWCFYVNSESREYELVGQYQLRIGWSGRERFVEKAWMEEGGVVERLYLLISHDISLASPEEDSYEEKYDSCRFYINGEEATLDEYYSEYDNFSENLIRIKETELCLFTWGEVSDEGDSQGERAAKMATALTSSPQRFLAK